MALGHEASGIVTAVGAGAGALRVGMRVAIECGIPCKAPTCARCSEGRYNLCPSLRFCSSAKTCPHLDGTLQRLMNHPVEWLHPLPQRLTYEQGALAEPLGVVLHAWRRASLTAPSPRVLVFGAGAVGLLACALARAQGASSIVLVDVNETRLQFAASTHFVDTTINTAGPSFAPRKPSSRSPPSKLPYQDAMDRAKFVADGILAASGLPADDGFDVVFECTGAETCIQSSIYVRLFIYFRGRLMER